MQRRFTAIAGEALALLGLEINGFATVALILEAAELLDVDHGAFFAMGEAEGDVSRFLRLLAKDGDDQPLLGRHFGLTLRSDLADEDVVGPDLCTDSDDAVFVEVLEGFLADVRNVAGDLFGPQLRIHGFRFVSFDMDRRVDVVLHEPFRDEDRVFVVVAAPRHKGHEHVLPQSQATVIAGCAVGENFAGQDSVAGIDDGSLREASRLVTLHGMGERVHVLLAAVRLDSDFRAGH